MQCGAGVGVAGVDRARCRTARRAPRRRSGASTVFRPWPEVDARQRDDEVADGGGVDQRLGRVAAQVHAGRVVDGGDAAPAQLGHGHCIAVHPRRGASSSADSARPTARGRPTRRPPGSSRSASRPRRSCGTACIVAVAIGVEQRISHGSSADRARDPVHLHLGRERRLGDAEAAQRARRLAVGVDAVARRSRRSGSCTGPHTFAACLVAPYGRVAASTRRRRASVVTLRATIRPSFITPSLIRIRLGGRVEDTASPPRASRRSGPAGRSS